MRSELELLGVWESLMGAASIVLSAIEADQLAKPVDVLGYLERVRNETSATNVEVSRITEGRRSA